jgi:hypothetical protein
MSVMTARRTVAETFDVDERGPTFASWRRGPEVAVGAVRRTKAALPRLTERRVGKSGEIAARAWCDDNRCTAEPAPCASCSPRLERA